MGTQEFLTLQLDVTNACNLSCRHCYHPHHRNAGAVKVDGWKEILNQYQRLLETLRLRPDLIFCGGEPLLSPLLPTLMDYCRSLWPDARFSILTNGTLISSDTLDSIRQYAPHFQVSLDGPDAPTHDEVRGRGAFDAAIKGVKKLVAEQLDTTLLAVLSRSTWPLIPTFFKLAKSLNVKAMNFTRLIVEGQAKLLIKDEIDSPLKGADLKDALTTIVRCAREMGMPTDTNQALYHLVDRTLGANGQMGFQGLVVDYKGNLKVASRTSPLLGNVFSEGLEKLFLTHPIMKTLRNRQIEGCGECIYYARCGGSRTSAFAATGSFFSIDPGCWLTPKQRKQK